MLQINSTFAVSIRNLVCLWALAAASRSNILGKAFASWFAVNPNSTFVVSMRNLVCLWALAASRGNIHGKAFASWFVLAPNSTDMLQISQTKTSFLPRQHSRVSWCKSTEVPNRGADTKTPYLEPTDPRLYGSTAKCFSCFIFPPLRSSFMTNQAIVDWVKD